jgi:exopolysaccharide biosynthesis polyprenyl glycosylphosphotransferase
LFSRQLSILFKSSVPVVESLQTIANQTKKVSFKEKIFKLSEKVEGGMPFSRALSLYPEVFNTFFINVVRSGEVTGKLSEVLEFCRANQLGFKMTPDLFLVRSYHVKVETVSGVPIMEFRRSPLDGWGRIIKRLVDLVGSTILIILTSPLMLISAIFVKITSKGPILYVQERVGLEKNFQFYKFRTMKTEYCLGEDYGGQKAQKMFKKLSKHNEADGPIFKLKDDPRLTLVGRLLRKTSIDELPQFFNVLRGNMSLIGPRPPIPEEVKQYTNWQRRRLGVKPGITGLWQVSGRSEVSFDEWVKLDAYYIENWSLWLDFQIFLKTIWVVIKGRGAY